MSIGVRRAVVIAALCAAAAAAVLAAPAAARTPVLTCGLHRGFVVYANGVTCPTAKKIVRRIDEMTYRAPKVTIRSIPGYICVATYKKTTKRMKAGSCLKLGTQATGFGWTKDGATVPLPPGASAPG
jgi:hypothetical protein